MHPRNALAIGPRVYLRPSDPDDAVAFARFSAIDPDPVWDRLRVPTSQMRYRHGVTDASKPELPRHLYYTVCLKDGDTPIGDVGFYDIDWINRNGETAAWIGDPAYRDNGYGTEAKFLLLEIAFDVLHLHVLTSWVWEPNKRSAAAVSKQGYRPAGRYPYDDVRGGEMRDGIVFDVLREDYLVARAAWEQRIAARNAAADEVGQQDA